MLMECGSLLNERSCKVGKMVISQFHSDRERWDKNKEEKEIKPVTRLMMLTDTDLLPGVDHVTDVTITM